MRLAYLYVKSRRTGHAAMALSVVAGLAWVWANAMLRVPTLGGNEQIYIPVLFLTPLVSASAIGVAAYSPFGEAEGTASRSMPTLRLGHLVGLLAAALATLAMAALDWRQEWAELILARNLAGFAGLALMAGTIVGSRLSWVVPLVYGIAAFRLGAIAPGRFAWWAWPIRPIGDELAAGVAIGLLATGLAAYALLGTRENPGEAE